MTVSTAVGRVLTGSGPRSLFGSFLVTQKGTRPTGRNPLRNYFCVKTVFPAKTVSKTETFGSS